MSTPERDPFELLPQFVDPEPDPAWMRTTIAQSVEAFERRKVRAVSGRSVSWLPRRRPSLSWVVPVAVGAVAMVTAVIIAQSLIPRQTGDSANEQLMAETPVLSRGEDPIGADIPIEAGQRGGGVRMGAQPIPRPPSVAPQSLSMSIFESDNVRLGVRLMPSAMLLYLPDLSTDQPFDSHHVLPGEVAEVLAAFRIAEQDVMTVQFRIGTATFWRAYRLTDGILARDAELTAPLSNALDAPEAMERLATN